jgi:hypothetical protein
MMKSTKAIDALNEIRSTIELFREWMAGTATKEAVAAQFDRAEEAIDEVAIPSSTWATGRIVASKTQKQLEAWRMGGFGEFRAQFEEYAY